MSNHDAKKNIYILFFCQERLRYVYDIKSTSKNSIMYCTAKKGEKSWRLLIMTGISCNEKIEINQETNPCVD